MSRRFNSLTFLVLAGFAPLSPSSPPAFAQGDRATAGITIQLQDVTLEDALERVHRETGIVCTVSPEVAKVRITLNVRDINPRILLRLIARQALPSSSGITLIAKGEGYELRHLELITRPREVGPRFDPDPRLEQTIDLDVTRLPLQQVCSKLFGPRSVEYEIDPKVAGVPITLKVTGTAVNVALTKVVREATLQNPDLRVTRSLGAYEFRQVERDPPSPELEKCLNERKVTAQFKNTPLKTAVARLFSGTSFAHSLAPELAEEPVSLNIENRPLGAALRDLIAKVHGAYMSATADIVIIQRPKLPIFDDARQP